MKLATPQSLPEGDSWSGGMIVSAAATKNACSVAVNVSSGSSTGGGCVAGGVSAILADGVADTCCAAAGAAGASAAAPATVRNSRRPIFGSFAMTVLPPKLLIDYFTSSSGFVDLYVSTAQARGKHFHHRWLHSPIRLSSGAQVSGALDELEPDLSRLIARPGQRNQNMRVATALLRALVAFALFAGAIGAWGVGTAAAQPAAPPAGYTIDPQFTQVSTDGAITVEQYLNKDTDDDWKWQFWVRRQTTFTLLDPEPAGYLAAFIFKAI